MQGLLPLLSRLSKLHVDLLKLIKQLFIPGHLHPKAFLFLTAHYLEMLHLSLKILESPHELASLIIQLHLAKPVPQLLLHSLESQLLLRELALHMLELFS
jgi:hypothetical protein